MIKDLFAIVFGLLLGSAILVGGAMVTTASETDPWFNCHISGNALCGPDTPWHGFVNEFSSDNTP